jgi:hypothetical protein
MKLAAFFRHSPGKGRSFFWKPAGIAKDRTPGVPDIILPRRPRTNFTGRMERKAASHAADFFARKNPLPGRPIAFRPARPEGMLPVFRAIEQDGKVTFWFDVRKGSPPFAAFLAGIGDDAVFPFPFRVVQRFVRPAEQF